MAKKQAPIVSETTGDKILPVSISAEMREAFLAYSMSVITSRALPDVRDGLKPVHRRILFAMNNMGLTFAAKPRKSATVVGEVLGKYHPHGDTSVYDAMVGMAQDFSYRYPLVWGQGNFGSIDGDAAAAMRYTEAKMSKVSMEFLRDLEKETVDFRPNYDDTLKEPEVLPAAVPGLLLNGTLGIAVGMATKIPPHNLGELIDATVTLIDDPTATSEDLMEHVQGPDFPTGAIAYNRKDILHASATGRGGVVVRGEAEIIEQKNGQFQIVITSIPYQVNKQTLIEKIASFKIEKKLDNMKDLRDESTTDIRIVIDLKSGANPQKVLNFLYKHTELESTFNYNIVALVDGVPQTLGIKEILDQFILHRREVVRRRSEYDLKKAEARAHILEGLKKALDHIDEIIKTIKASKDTGEAKANLMKKFKFSEIQAQAILEMKLQKLAGLERKKIEEELKEVLALIASLKDLLAHPKKMLAVIKSELLEIKEKYPDERRTKIVKSGVKSISEEDLIPQQEAALVFTAGGYIKRTDPKEFRVQKRGGVGVVDLDTKEEDVVTDIVIADTHSYVLFFTDKGKVYQMKMYDIPEGRRATKGKSIRNYLSIAPEEKITSILAVPKELQRNGCSLFLVTEKGVVKKVPGDSFTSVRASGLIAINLKDSDTLLSAHFVGKDDHAFLATEAGQSIRFEVGDVRDMGRTAAGVRGINVKKNDRVIGASIITKEMKNPKLLVVTANGLGKRTDVDEYKVQNRGGSGIKTVNITPKTGKLIDASVVHDDMNEMIIISKKSQVIRVAISEVPSIGRATQGVSIMKLRAGDGVASVSIL